MSTLRRTKETASTRLSRELILEAALDLADREGWQALSMRGLAQELDVWPMAIYRYYPEREALLDAVTDAAVGRVRTPRGRGSWRIRLVALLRDVRGALRPSVSEVPPDRALLTPSGLRISAPGVMLLEQAGLERAEATRAWVALFRYAAGFGAGGEPALADHARRARAALAELPTSDYAGARQVGEELATALDEGGGFEYGLERLLDGIEAQLRDRHDE